MTAPRTPIRKVRVDAWRVPTEAPESDGTLAWDATTLVAVRIEAGACSGLGWTYGHRAAAAVVEDTLGPLLCGREALDTPALHAAAVAALRNAGHPGLGAMAVSALDVGLWDLKGRLLEVSLTDLLGAARERIPVYGSGGFTSDDDARLQAQLGGWVEQGMRRVKMKVGREPGRDIARVRSARAAIGPEAGLMVDANGAYDRVQALAMACALRDEGVDWFEEPVSSDDLEGLHRLRDRSPAGLEIAAGEYGWDTRYFARMLGIGAVDVLQADATRCGGCTGFIAAAALADAMQVPLSAHCAPALHAAIGAALPGLRHIEYFHDHVRLESLAFDGVPALEDGALAPSRERPGHGLALRESDLAPYRV